MAFAAAAGNDAPEKAPASVRGRSGKVALPSASADLASLHEQLAAMERRAIAAESDMLVYRNERDTIMAAFVHGVRRIRDSVEPILAATEDALVGLQAAIVVDAPKVGTSVVEPVARDRGALRPIATDSDLPSSLGGGPRKILEALASYGTGTVTRALAECAPTEIAPRRPNTRRLRST